MDRLSDQASFIILKYIRAQREADWALQLNTAKEMMPLFFAAGYTHYAQYALHYLNTMEHLPAEVHKHFRAHEHTMHRTPSLFNGHGSMAMVQWSDMAIDTTYMRYGHGRQGIVGITLKPDSLEIWA